MSKKFCIPSLKHEVKCEFDNSVHSKVVSKEEIDKMLSEFGNKIHNGNQFKRISADYASFKNEVFARAFKRRCKGRKRIGER